MAGGPQRSAIELLGHRDPRTSVPYQHRPPGHLRDVMRALARAATARPTSVAVEAHGVAA